MEIEGTSIEIDADSEEGRQKFALLLQHMPMAMEKPPEPDVRFEVAGVQVEIHLSGEGQEISRRFLREYFRPFSPTMHGAREADLVIHYAIAPGPLSSGKHPYWNETSYEFDRRPYQGGLMVSQRDFVAHVLPDGTRAFAMGPLLDEGVTDSIDNLVMATVTRILPKKSSLALHAATVLYQERAWVFFGASGAGKSTLACQSYALDGLKVLSGDQIYLTQKSGRLWACPCTTTIADFPRRHPGLELRPWPVQGLVHLLPTPRIWGLRTRNTQEILPAFLRQTIYWQEFEGAQDLLGLAVEMLQTPGLFIAEMSYEKGRSFWPHLENTHGTDKVEPNG